VENGTSPLLVDRRRGGILRWYLASGTEKVTGPGKFRFLGNLRHQGHFAPNPHTHSTHTNGPQ
jgi:hypothetical protein